jgi:arsenite methyltransferase
MRELPFANNSFDVVIACLSVHNIESPEGRHQAISEIVRVLKRNGRVVLLDIFFINEYPEMLRANGMQNVRLSGRNFLYYPPLRTVKARKR